MKRVYCIADNIVSNLGWSSEENLDAVLRGESGISLHQDELAEPYMAALTDRDAVKAAAAEEGIDTEEYSYFELLCILSVTKALKSVKLDFKRTQLILSSTKGNIALAKDPQQFPLQRLELGESAKLINSHFGLELPPVIISNACISGVCAEIEGMRRIRAGLCDSAIVVGCDEQSRFIVSGFQSFKALSNELCRPFDADRRGLNLGEAAATVVLTSLSGNCGACDKSSDNESRRWEIVDGAIRNDANHISGPSRTGEGSFRALKYVLESPLWDCDNVKEQLAVVNAHGTATPYNDEMESIAIDRAGLSSVPVNSLKAYFGHTMGAAGILETILSMHATQKGILLPTKGYANCGVSHPLDISPLLRNTDKSAFIKLISGFGGCNAAVAFRLQESGSKAEGAEEEMLCKIAEGSEEEMPRWKKIAEAGVRADEDLIEAYKSLHCEYPKFYKMDPLCKTGFIASERLLRGNGLDLSIEAYEKEDRAIVLTNRSASLCNDLHYQSTISDKDNYFPSPSLFVYTLPNIVTGEIAIRNKMYGESIFYIDSEESKTRMDECLALAFQDRDLRSAVSGWVEASAEGKCEASIALLVRDE